MTIFDSGKTIEFLATQSLHYDRYSSRLYFLERLAVAGKYGLICGEQSDEYGRRAKVLLPPVYDEIRITKISTHKAIYDRYLIVADGDQIGQFTLGINAWVPAPYYNKN